MKAIVRGEGRSCLGLEGPRTDVRIEPVMDKAGMSNGLLLVTTNVDRRAEDAFTRWYDEEHIPERLAIPGVFGADRFVRVPSPLPPDVRAGTLVREPSSHLVLYHLDHADVVTSEAWATLNRHVSNTSVRAMALMRDTYRGSYRLARRFPLGP